MNTTNQSQPRCAECGAPLTRAVTGTMALSVTTLCPNCDRSG